MTESEPPWGGPTVCSFIGLSQGTQRNFIGKAPCLAEARAKRERRPIRGCPEAVGPRGRAPCQRVFRARPLEESRCRNDARAPDRTGRSRGTGSPAVNLEWCPPAYPERGRPVAE